MKYSDLIFYSALFWSVVIGSTVNPGKGNAKLDAAKKLESSSNSTNLLKENESAVALGNDSDLTIVLPDNTTQTKLQTDIKAPETKVSNISKILPISHNENKTNKVTPVPVFPTTAPELGKWIIKDESTNKTCIVAQMKMQLNLTYPGSVNKVENATINGPGKNSTAKGSCSNETIIITWSPNHSLEINFENNNTANDFFISSLSVKVNATVFPNVKENISTLIYSSNFSELFETPLNMSYKCGKLQTLNLSSSHSEFQAVVTLRDTQFQAFMNNIKPDFGVAQDCEIFDTPDIVPIAVGTALAILVVVVLIAYLVGRRRSQNRGYLSM